MSFESDRINELLIESFKIVADLESLGIGRRRLATHTMVCVRMLEYQIAR